MDRKVIKTDKAPQAIGPYSVAIRAGDLVFTSGQIGIDLVSQQLVDGGVMVETRQVLTNLKNVLESSGSRLDLVVKTTIYLKDMADFQTVNKVYADFFPNDPPARSAVAVAALPKGAAVEIEAVAVTD